MALLILAQHSHMFGGWMVVWWFRIALAGTTGVTQFCSTYLPNGQPEHVLMDKAQEQADPFAQLFVFIVVKYM